VSKLDTIFGPIPGPLISEWGQSMTFIRNSGEGTYNQATGTVTTTETRIPVKAIITQVSPSEVEGSLESTDVKIMIDAAQLGSTYITTADQFEYTEDTATITANIVSINIVRGDSPIFYTCFARQQ
tara:strand:+ start:1508 stop:1885 length:378 start_codon:yes stop_codon:yes gene_type:complete